MTNKILVTKHFLHKINKIDNNLCEYCQQAPETIFHLFIEYEIVKRSWKNLKAWLNNNANINISLTNRAILFANQDNNSLKSYIMILAKYYVYANKFDMTDLSIDRFINMLGKKFQAERYIANQNNTIVKYLKKLAPIFSQEVICFNDSIPAFEERGGNLTVLPFLKTRVNILNVEI